MRALADEMGPVLGSTDRGRGPGRRRRLDRRDAPAPTRRRTATPSAFFPARPSSSTRSSQPIGLRSEEEPGADHPAVLSDAGVRGERLARRQIVRRARGAGEGQAQDPELHGAVAVEGRLHGGVQQEERHRHRPRAVQGRRRRRQQHAQRHHADRDLRHRQSDRSSSATEKSSASPSTATSARRSRPTFRRSRRSATPSTSAATFFGIFAPAGTPKPIVDKLNKAIVKVGIESGIPAEIPDQPRPERRCLISPEQFAKELPADRAEGLAVVKASGLYPDVK